MVSLTNVLTDAVALVALLGLVWRSSAILTQIRAEVRALRSDVDEITNESRQARARIYKRLLRLERQTHAHHRNR